MLKSTLPDVKLQYDAEKSAKFLKVHIDEGVPDGFGKLWNMKVSIEPNSVNGRFPDPDKPGDRDCAIYLNVYRQTGEMKQEDKPWRRIRIPVSGDAIFQ